MLRVSSSAKAENGRTVQLMLSAHRNLSKDDFFSMPEFIVPDEAEARVALNLAAILLGIGRDDIRLSSSAGQCFVTLSL